MSQQTSFSIEDAKELLTQLQQFRDVLVREWSRVSNQWHNLSMTWHDEQRTQFEPIYSKLLGTYADAQQEAEQYIAFLDNQIRIADERKQKLSGLKDF